MSSEKTPEALADIDNSDNSTVHNGTVEELGISQPTNKLQRFCNRLDAIAGVEARGIERIPEELRERDVSVRDFVHMFTM